MKCIPDLPFLELILFYIKHIAAVAVLVILALAVVMTFFSIKEFIKNRKKNGK